MKPGHRLERPAWRGGFASILVMAGTVALLAGPLVAQEASPAVPPPARAASGMQVPPDSVQGVSPGGAFLRSLVLPGWGHLVTGSPTRGGFYFGSAAFNGYMLYKTQVRITTARDIEQMQRDAVTRELVEQGVSPDSIPDLVDQDPRVEDAVALLDAREQQMEDWIAWSVFMVLLGGADAFVSAHLKDFPEPLSIEARPVGTGGRVEVGVSLPYRGPGG